jgi:carbon-monoxide dehydrogenase medium subunit
MTMAGTSANPVLAVHRSRKMIPAFRLRRPRSPAEAVAMQAAASEDAVFMAGGIDLLSRMKFGEPVAEVIYLGGITELGTIAGSGGGLRLGSLVTHYQLETSATVRTHFPVLAQTWQDVANIRIRCKGTIGGNIMAVDPDYDFALAAMAAGAQLDFLGKDGATRTVPAMELNGSSSYGLLTTITFPFPARLCFAFDRSLRPAVTLALGLDLEVGKVAAGRVAIGCAFAAPMAAALPLAEPLPARELAPKAAILARDLAASLPELLGDSHGSAGYRRRMIEILLRRNLGMLADRLV